MSGGDVLVVALVILQAVWGLFLTLLSFTAKRIHNDLASNTAATRELSQGLAELNDKLLSGFATKDAVRGLGDKYDRLNREMGELSARVNVGVLHYKPGA